MQRLERKGGRTQEKRSSRSFRKINWDAASLVAKARGRKRRKTTELFFIAATLSRCKIQFVYYLTLTRHRSPLDLTLTRTLEPFGSRKTSF